MKTIMLGFAMALGAFACSSSDPAASPSTATSSSSGSPTTTTDGGGGTSVDAPARCAELVGLFCARSVECTPSDAGTPEAQKQSCIEAVGGALNCEAATSIGDTYPSCTTEMPQIDCANFAANSPDLLPQSCRGVVMSPTPPAPPAPETTLPAVTKPNIILGD